MRSFFIPLAFFVSIGLMCGGPNDAFADNTNAAPKALVSDTHQTIHVLGAVNEQGPVELSGAEANQSLAAILTAAVSKAGGFKDFAKTDKLLVYFKEGVDKKGVQYNNECKFRYNTDDRQSDEDCKVIMKEPARIYRVFVEGNTRTSIWSYVKDGLKLFGNIAIPVILATE